MFSFSVIVIKKLLKAMAMFVGAFNFSSFTSKVGAYSTECTFPVSFLIVFDVVFILLLDFVIILLLFCFLASCIILLRILQY